MPRINGEISSRQIRLIDADGNMLGVCTPSEAISKAENLGLDLVEISPAAEPPVCKIMDFGKYKYEIKKKANIAKKNQKTIVIKEIKLRPNISENDLNIKIKNIVRFLEDGDKVKVSLKFRGREVTHQEIGMNIMEKIISTLGENAKIDSGPRFDGSQIFLSLSPKALI